MARIEAPNRPKRSDAKLRVVVKHSTPGSGHPRWGWQVAIGDIRAAFLHGIEAPHFKQPVRGIRCGTGSRPGDYPSDGVCEVPFEQVVLPPCHSEAHIGFIDLQESTVLVLLGEIDNAVVHWDAERGRP